MFSNIDKIAFAVDSDVAHSIGTSFLRSETSTMQHRYNRFSSPSNLG
jgi:hypothetical protein